jgi:hypothetical protein
MEVAMDYVAQNGVSLYASAGNENTGEPIFPAGFDNVTAVGGLNPQGDTWVNSNRGDFVTEYQPAFAEFDGKLYQGTSVSAPLAAFKAAQ